MSDWFAFYSVAAAAAATLMGLLFVAVSIAASTAFNDRQSPIRSLAEQSFQNYLLVLIISGIALFPLTGRTTMGGVMLFATASRVIWALIRLRAIAAYAANWRARLNSLRRQIASLAGLICLLIASTHMAFDVTDTSHLLAAGTLVLLASSAVASWEMLLQLVRDRTDNA